jgi:RNA polymerase sigma-70 factor (ECF subfamily)
MSLAIDWWRTQKGEDPMIYLDEVFRYAATRLGSREDAEDVAIEVVQALPNPCHRRDLRVYMFGMARRKVIDRLRRPKAIAEVRETDAIIRFDIASDEASLVASTLGELTEDHREVLTLKYMVGLSSAEIGKITGKKPEAIDSMLQRARDAFAQSWNRISSDEVKR